MRVTVFFIDIVIQRQRDNMLILHAIFFQIFRKQFKQQKAFPATANTGYHLDQTIITALNQLIQISVPLDYHNFTLLN